MTATTHAPSRSSPPPPPSAPQTSGLYFGWVIVGACTILTLLTVGIYTVLATDPFGVTTNPKWLGAKVALYALAMLCGSASCSSR